MNHEYLIQCKRVILNNKKSDKYINLSLADKLYLILLSRRIRKRGLDNMSFEEFTLLCKHHRKHSTLRVESKYSTNFIDILHFNVNTLYNLINKVLNEIELYNDKDNYKDLENITHLMLINRVILFNLFIDICDKLDIKVSIE